MKNVTVAQIISYTRLQASAGVWLVEKLKKPRHRDENTINSASSYLDVWEASLTKAARHCREAENLLLKIENLEPLEERDFEVLDELLDKYRLNKAA